MKYRIWSIKDNKYGMPVYCDEKNKIRSNRYGQVCENRKNYIVELSTGAIDYTTGKELYVGDRVINHDDNTGYVGTIIHHTHGLVNEFWMNMKDDEGNCYTYTSLASLDTTNLKKVGTIHDKEI